MTRAKADSTTPMEYLICTSRISTQSGSTLDTTGILLSGKRSTADRQKIVSLAACSILWSDEFRDFLPFVGTDVPGARFA
ncbi:hypothetical protein [Paraburkholderia pallida]|uniref:Uncharacterized protein n=1 Tax=Paraburkholderia pallida TaxID=2547399 RepID=A0A4P7DA76_9BURK|nr:hypothetical protein [Paraburkholderia pallida]QBR04160.1 hypothetical protein E1956_44275 [Paraburkholderia pallida]